MGHFSTQEPSKSLPFENGFTSSTASPEPDLKRKRGYFPYTEDDESNLLGNIKTPAFQSSPGIVRTFQDSIPWYQWKRKSFATPEERVKSFKPPESESESEDEFFDAAEPETQKSEARISETRYIGKTLFQQCSGIEDPSIISEGDKFKGIPKVSKLEARLESGLYSFVEQMRNGLEEVQSGVAWMYKRAYQFLRDNVSREPAPKRQKHDPQIAIIPQDAQWPPNANQRPVQPKYLSRKRQDPISKRTKVSNNYQQYVNARFDSFVAQRKCLGFCVCKCRRPFPKILQKSLKSPLPGTYPPSDEEIEKKSSDETTLLTRRSRPTMRLTPKNPNSSETVVVSKSTKTGNVSFKNVPKIKTPTHTKSPKASSRIRKGITSQRNQALPNGTNGSVSNHLKQTKKGNKKMVKRRYMFTPIADVYYL